MNVPDDRRYLDTHEWHQLNGEIVTIGLTQFAADELTDITYVELPEPGKQIKAGSSFGEIESVKATADLTAGMSGIVTETNARLADEPELMNSDPFCEGWMIRIRASDPQAYEKLLDANAYRKLIAG